MRCFRSVAGLLSLGSRACGGKWGHTNNSNPGSWRSVLLIFVLPLVDSNCAQEWASRGFGTNLFATFCQAAWPQCQELFMTVDHLYQRATWSPLSSAGGCSWSLCVCHTCGVLLSLIFSITLRKGLMFNCADNAWLECGVAKNETQTKASSKGWHFRSL